MVVIASDHPFITFFNETMPLADLNSNGFNSPKEGLFILDTEIFRHLLANLPALFTFTSNDDLIVTLPGPVTTFADVVNDPPENLAGRVY